MKLLIIAGSVTAAAADNKTEILRMLRPLE